MQKESLFRDEVIQQISQTSLGEVTIVQPLSLKLLTLFLVATVAATCLFLWTGEYARKQTVRGYLEPNLGVAEIYPKSSGGVIQDIFVESAQQVSQGQALIKIRYPRTSNASNNSDALAEVLATLKEQRTRLLKQQALQRDFFISERSNAREKIAEASEEVEQQQIFLNLHINLMAISEQQFNSSTKLYKKGVIPKTQWLQTESERLSQQKELVSIEQRLAQLQAAKRAGKRELEILETREAEDTLQLALRLSETEQRISQVAAERTEVLLASVPGRVTALQTQVGAKANQAIPLLSIIPSSSDLEAILHVPSAAMGFVTTGKTVRLTLDAYPHQQFGTLPAEIISVAQAPIAAHELAGPLRATNPVFLVKAKLSKQTMLAIGKERELQPGMLVRADIILERRSLIDWLLEPLYNLRGRSA